MLDQSAWIFLKVIGGQPAIFRADEMFKIQPGGACQQSQFFLLRRRNFYLGLDILFADARCNIRRNDPAKQQRCGEEQNIRILREVEADG